MRVLLRHLVVVTLAVGGLAQTAHADKTFNIGSLILPASASYQSDCGAVAIYGLAYDVLRANAWLEANRATVCPGMPATQTCKIELHYAVNSNKKSPNRCTPTNKDVGPPYPGVPSPLTTDATWNDGCDFSVFSAVTTPVKLVTNTTSPPSTATDTNVVTNTTTGIATVYPNFTGRTVNNTGVTPATDITTVRYGGGPFIIDAIDAPLFLKLLSGTPLAVGKNYAKDSQNNDIDFSPFRTGLGACAFGTSIGGYVNVHRAKAVFTAPVLKTFSTAPPRVALLATLQGVSSTDQVTTSAKSIAATTASSATSGASKVTATGVITIRTSNNHGFATGDYVWVSGVGNASYNNTGGTVYTVLSVPGSKSFTVQGTPAVALGLSGGGTATRVGIWKNAATGVITVRTNGSHGLTVGTPIEVADTSVAGYNGSPFTVATVINTTTFTINTAPSSLNPSGNGNVTNIGTATTKKISNGILQDYLANAGLSFVGAAGCPVGGINVGDTTKCPSIPGGPRGQIYDTFDFADVATKLDPTYYKMLWTPHWESKGTSTTAPTSGEQTMITKVHDFLDGQTGLMAECHSIEAFEGAYKNGVNDQQGYIKGQFQTCVKGTGSTWANPVCSATTTVFGVNKDVSNPPEDGYYANCSDPTRANGAQCIYYGYPEDPFSQTGDYMWNNHRGSVQNYVPNSANSPNTTYKPGVRVLISGVSSLNRSMLTDPVTARGMIAADYASRNNKDNDTNKANILYVSGHDLSGVVAGTKVILQTLLLLGEPAIASSMQEVTRSSPIIVLLNSTASLVQGSFERLDPAGTTVTADSDLDVDGFRFPDLQGHMRAIAVADVGERNPAPTLLKDLSDVFDVADVVAQMGVTLSGCGANAFGKAGGNCRTIFTHTADGVAPARVLIDNNASSDTALKAAINGGPSAGSINSNFQTFLQRIVAGDDTSGSFRPKLGGVDRSTVAVIPASTVAGSNTRPTMVYFGATDGMLHAVCGSVTAGNTAPCDALGRELWGYIPKRQLPWLRKNLARVDGSPRVLDVFADLDGAGAGGKTFKTLLVFQTTYGDPAVSGAEPSMTALDITDPTDPKIVWEVALPGQGLIVNVGRVSTPSGMKYYAYAQTNNGAANAGNVVTAIDVETGAQVWKNGGPTVGSSYVFTPGTAPGRLSGTVPPVTAIPGGAVAFDATGSGNTTDVVFGTIYGDIWQLDAATGVGRYGAEPLFQYAADQHPIGAPITLYGDGSLYGIAVPGGYVDLAADTLWSTSSQTAVAVRLHPLMTTADTPLSESSGAPGVKWTFGLDAGYKSFGQAVVSGGEVFITADSEDTNSLTYGNAVADTGKVYKVSLGSSGTATATSTVIVAGGAGSVAMSGNGVYNVSKNGAEKLGSSMNTDGTPGVSLNTGGSPKVSRKLWLRTL